MPTFFEETRFDRGHKNLRFAKNNSMIKKNTNSSDLTKTRDLRQAGHLQFGSASVTVLAGVGVNPVSQGFKGQTSHMRGWAKDEHHRLAEEPK